MKYNASENTDWVVQGETQIRGFWAHLCIHINTTYTLITIYITTIFWHAIWIPICMLIIFKEDWQSSLVKVIFITSKVLISTRFSFSYLESFFSLNMHWQSICDKYFNLVLQSTFLSLTMSKSLRKHSRETKNILLPQGVYRLWDWRKIEVEK